MFSNEDDYYWCILRNWRRYSRWIRIQNGNKLFIVNFLDCSIIATICWRGNHLLDYGIHHWRPSSLVIFFFNVDWCAGIKLHWFQLYLHEVRFWMRQVKSIAFYGYNFHVLNPRMIFFFCVLEVEFKKRYTRQTRI